MCLELSTYRDTRDIVNDKNENIIQSFHEESLFCGWFRIYCVYNKHSGTRNMKPRKCVNMFCTGNDFLLSNTHSPHLHDSSVASSYLSGLPYSHFLPVYVAGSLRYKR